MTYGTRHRRSKNVATDVRLRRHFALHVEDGRRPLAPIVRCIREADSPCRDVLSEDGPHEDLVGRFRLVARDYLFERPR